MKRILSLVLCVIMIAAMLTVSVNAASADVYSEGVVDGYYTWAYDFTKAAETKDLAPNNGEESGVAKNEYGMNMKANKYWYTDIVLDNLTEKVEIIFTATAAYKGHYFDAALGNGEEDVQLVVDNSAKPSSSYATYTVKLTFDPVTGKVYNGNSLKGTITINPETKVLRLKFVAGDKSHGTVKTLTIKQEHIGATLPTPEEVAAAIKVDGYQKSAVENEVYKVRFAVVINGFFADQNYVGVEITTTAGGGKSWDLNTNEVYRSLTASFGTEKVTAEERGGEYITAAAITGVPTSEGVIEFVITPYVIIGEDKVYGEAKTVIVDPAAAE